MVALRRNRAIRLGSRSSRPLVPSWWRLTGWGSGALAVSGGLPDYTTLDSVRAVVGDAPTRGNAEIIERAPKVRVVNEEVPRFCDLRYHPLDAVGTIVPIDHDEVERAIGKFVTHCYVVRDWVIAGAFVR